MPKKKRVKRKVSRKKKKDSIDIPIYKDLKPDTKKRIRIGLIAIIVTVVLIIIGLFFLGIRVRFLLDDELNLDINPINPIVTAENDDTVNIIFSVKNDNFLQCKSSCEFKLLDLRNNSIIFSDMLKMNHNQIYEKEFSLKMPGTGSGQILFSFAAECRNLNSILCLTDSKKRIDSSLLIVNYDLNQKEIEIIDIVKENIENYNNVVSEAEKIIEENRLLMNRIPDENILKKESEIRKDILEKDFRIIKKKQESLLNLWREEDYLGLNEEYSSKDLSEITDLKNKILDFQEELIDAIKLRNSNLDLLNLIIRDKEKIVNAGNFISNHANSENKNKALQINNAINNLYNSYLNIGSGKDFSEEKINMDLGDNIRSLYEIVDGYNEDLLIGTGYQNFLGNYLNNGNYGFNSFECGDYTEILTNIEIRNINASNYGIVNYLQDYNSVEFKEFLADLEKRFINISFDSTINNVLLSDSTDVDKIIELMSENIIIEDYNLGDTINVTENEFGSLIILNLSLYQGFFDSFCKNESNTLIDDPDIITLSKIDPDDDRYSYKNISIPEVSIVDDTALPENLPQCCVFSECKTCGFSESKTNPIVFIHGHSFNKENNPEFDLNAFSKIQDKLQEDGFVNGGILDFSEMEMGEWGKSGVTFTTRATYYTITDYEIGDYTVIAQKTERIENYALRLKELINLYKFRTGAEKVTIVAHSMGSLVSRQFISLFGTDDIHKLIMINPPNHGISGRVKNICSLFGSQKECEDMAEDSIFLRRLNSNIDYSDIEVHNIRSVGCLMDEGKDGDGIVTNESAYLDAPGVTNHLIEGECTDSLQTNLHSNVLDPELYPESYELLLGILTE